MTLKEALKFESTSTTSQGQKNMQNTFKSSLMDSYDQPDDGLIFDMATGRRLPYTLVVAAHIFQHKWQDRLPQLMLLKNIDDMCNGLLLYKPVEKAFNAAKLCIEVNPEGKMTFRLFDDDFRDLELTEYACQLRKQANCGDWRLKEEEDLHITFGDLDGQEVHFPDGVEMRPSKRLLAIHAVAAHWIAQDKARALGHQISDVRFDTSDDESANVAIKNISILKWRENLEY